MQPSKSYDTGLDPSIQRVDKQFMMVCAEQRIKVTFR